MLRNGYVRFEEDIGVQLLESCDHHCLSHNVGLSDSIREWIFGSDVPRTIYGLMLDPPLTVRRRSILPFPFAVRSATR